MEVAYPSTHSRHSDTGACLLQQPARVQLASIVTLTQAERHIVGPPAVKVVAYYMRMRTPVGFPGWSMHAPVSGAGGVLLPLPLAITLRLPSVITIAVLLTQGSPKDGVDLCVQGAAHTGDQGPKAGAVRRTHSRLAATPRRETSAGRRKPAGEKPGWLDGVASGMPDGLMRLRGHNQQVGWLWRVIGCVPPRV